MNAKAAHEAIETTELTLSVSDINLSRMRIRRELDPIELDQLASSMACIGQLQRIGVYRMDDGYELIFGQRRLCAARKLNWPTLKATVFKLGRDSKHVVLSIMAAENLQSERLKTIEKIAIISKLQEGGISNCGIAEVLSQSLDWVKDHEFVMQDPLARSIAEAGSLMDAASLHQFLGFPPLIRNLLMETA